MDSSTELGVAVTEQDSLVLETREEGLRRARALVRKYIPAEVELSAELISDRRVEALREAASDESLTLCTSNVGSFPDLVTLERT